MELENNRVPITKSSAVLEMNSFESGDKLKKNNASP
jgi:hypothetical protein